MRFKVFILAFQSHFSFSHLCDKIAVSHLATVPDNLELIAKRALTVRPVAGSVPRLSTNLYQPIRPRCESLLDDPHAAGNPWFSGWASDTVYPTFRSAHGESLTPGSQTKPRLPQQRRSHPPSPPPRRLLCFWLTPLETRSPRSRSVKFAPRESSVMQNS